MEHRSELAEVFLAHWGGPPPQPEEIAALEGVLRRAWEDARARWPAVSLPAGIFGRHLAERLPQASAERPIASQLEEMFLPELYLACACEQGIPAALLAFEQHYLAKLPGALRTIKRSDAVIDEVCQRVRVKMLVRTPESGPRIAEYGGRGSLQNWVLVAAKRMALRLIEGEEPGAENDVEAMIDVLPAPGVDLEMDLIKQRHYAEFRQALREAFFALLADDRHLLRLHFVDRLTETKMAGLFRVNQATISRWLKRIRKTVHDDTRDRLQKRLGLSAREVQSFLAGLSQISLSFSQLFGEELLAQPPAGTEAADSPSRGRSDPR